MVEEDMERQQNEEREEGEGDGDGDGEGDGEGEGEEQVDVRGLERHLMRMLMENEDVRGYMEQREIEEQKEREMIELAIQESLKENPNVDVMNYEQLQELEERIGSVCKGFSDKEISMIPNQI